MHGREVGEHVLGPARGHQRHGVPGLDAQLGQASGQVEGRLANLTPGDRPPAGAVLAGDADLVGVGRLVAEGLGGKSEEHTSELQSLMRSSYAVLCLKKTKKN